MLADAEDSTFHHECIASGFTMTTKVEGRDICRPVSVLLHDDYDSNETNALVEKVGEFENALDLEENFTEVQISNSNAHRVYDIAMAVMALASPQGFYCIDYIAVDPQLRGLGLGKRTLEDAEKLLVDKDVFLYTTQEENVGWYKKNGYLLVKSFVFVKENTEYMEMFVMKKEKSHIIS